MTVLAAIEAQTGRTPDAIALVHGAETVTYRELDERANRLAHHLIGLGAGAGTLAGICGDRSIDLVTGILAVLKTGAAYVPLDPRHPPARLAMILEDARPSVLLAGDAQAGALPDRGIARVPLAGVGGQPAHRPAVAIDERDLAYVMFTSGSTGRPKGVMISHRNVTHLAGGLAEVFGIAPDDRVLQFASFAFDVSAGEILMALTSGATLVLAPATDLLPGPALADLVREQRVTVIVMPPSALALLDPADLPSVRLAVTTGEECSPAVAARWAPVGLVNAYGPTETTVWAAATRVRAGAPTVPIGVAWPGGSAYVLDDRMQPLPPGVAGHLHVGGPGLARGYLGRPDLTADVFVPHPYGDGSLLYRTGDLARLNDDGDLEYLGRADDQVKLHGFRIEPGEIGNALSALDGVRDAQVVLRADVPGDQRLVAYLITEPGTPAETDRLRAELARTLPDYMIPAAFVVLDAFPVGPTGKVDRRALPAPGTGRPDLTVTYAEPVSPGQSAVADIFRTVLRVDDVGLDDHFFDVGGGSLQLLRVRAAVAQRLGCELSMAEVFGNPTVRGLSAVVQEKTSRAG
nr:non-ribosomal peptide synthetase [uncultured Actinoplanes sp.]